MEYQNCLNCGETRTSIFCPTCGQKSDTHRITIKHFILHDLLHGVWHLERGMLFTLKETFVRPGQAALDYIGGKRIRYYNIFYLCLLIIGLNVVLVHMYDSINPDRLHHQGNDVRVLKFLSQYLKFILLSVVPIIALNAYVTFRKLKLNLAEHFVLSGINLLGILVINTLFLFFNFLNELEYSATVTGIFEVLTFFMMFSFPVWTYFNANKKVYKPLAFLWRIIIFYLLALIQIALVAVGIIHAVTGKSELRIDV